VIRRSCYDGSLPNFKDIVDLIKKGSTLEAQGRIQELQDALYALREENRALREENHRLREELETRTALTFDGYHYWATRDGRKDGPYCPTCQDRDQKRIRLQSREPGAWRCNCCDGFFPDAAYHDPRSNTVADTDFDVFKV